MHGHPAAAGHEADDLVAGHRMAAARQPDERVVETLDHDAPPGVRRLPRGAVIGLSSVNSSARRLGLGALALLRHQLQSLVPTCFAETLPGADGRENVVGVRVVHLLATASIAFSADLQPMPRPCLRITLASSSRPRMQVVLARHLAEVVADLLVADDVLTMLSQSRDGLGVLVGEDLDAVAHLQLIAERHDRPLTFAPTQWLPTSVWIA